MRKVDLVVLFETRELLVPGNSRFDADFIKEVTWEYAAKWIIDGEDLVDFCRLLGLDVAGARAGSSYSIWIRGEDFIRWTCLCAEAEIVGGVLRLVVDHEDGRGEYSYSGRFVVCWKDELEEEP